MPVLGLGVWQMSRGKETEQAVEWALEAGYRLVDTATWYRNERSVGTAIRRSGLPREQVFVTTKLLPTHARASRELAKSLERLGLEYVDLYLIHWPRPLRNGRLWRELESLEDQGLAREIGVSNFGVDTLERLLRGAHSAPAVNQVQFSPFHYRSRLLAYCREHRIAFEAYSPARPRARCPRRNGAGSRRTGRAHTGPGAAPLGAPARSDRDPQVERPRADPLERPGVRLRARSGRGARAGRARPDERKRRRPPLTPLCRAVATPPGRP